MTPVLSLLTTDACLGRVDHSSFSDQTLMEMIFEEFDETTKQNYKGEDGSYLDVCEWPCVKCDGDERVVEIVEYSHITGTIQLSYLPSKVRALYIQIANLRGSVELANLPESMEVLNLNSNRLTGPIDLTHAPNRMEKIDLGGNQCLGSLDLTHLPETMQDLHLENNKFSGSIDVTHLPRGMRSLQLQGNQLSGSFLAMHISHSLKRLDASENNFSAKAVVDLAATANILLSESGVATVVDQDGNTHPRETVMIGSSFVPNLESVQQPRVQPR